MEMLNELSALTGQTKGGMVSELMVAALPAMQASADAIKMVKDAPMEAQALLGRFANEATMRLAQTQLQLSDLLEEKPRLKRHRAKKGMADDGAT